MFRMLFAHFRRSPVVTTMLAIVVLWAAVLCAAQIAAWGRWQVFSAELELAGRAHDPSPGRATISSWSFAFGDVAVRLRVPVAPVELERARKVDTGPVFLARGKLREAYVVRLVRAQSESCFIGGLATELRRVRDERGLDDDEYLELLVRAVQSLPYGIEGWRVRLPVEAVASGFGDCADKALLLGALMIHEGYKTGMWVLDSQGHAALGVASDGATFRDSGYAYIETTAVSYIGQVADGFRAAGPIASPPQFIPIGGTRVYRAGREVEYILRELAQAQESSARLEPYVRLANFDTEARGAQYQELALQRLSAAGLAAYIRGQSDQREAVFERLVVAASKAAGDPALLR